MKLRTVVNELACDAIWPARPELLDANVLLTPEYGSTTPGDMLFVRLCRLLDCDKLVHIRSLSQHCLDIIEHLLVIFLV